MKTTTQSNFEPTTSDHQPTERMVAMNQDIMKISTKYNDARPTAVDEQRSSRRGTGGPTGQPTTLKAARLAGFVEKRDIHHGGHEIHLRGRTLVRDPLTAKTTTAWRKLGFRVAVGESPYTAAKFFGVSRPLYRDTQVVPLDALPAHYARIFSHRYSTRSDAIGDAAEAMFKLNRFAKRLGRFNVERDQIYALKNQFVFFLCANGYLLEVGRHEDVKPERERLCFGCDATGFHWTGEQCYRCDGTGIYDRQPCLVLRYTSLRFAVCERTYSWHQPEQSVTWPLPDVPRFEAGDGWTPGQVRGDTLDRDAVVRLTAIVQWSMGLLPSKSGSRSIELGSLKCTNNNPTLENNR